MYACPPCVDFHRTTFRPAWVVYFPIAGPSPDTAPHADSSPAPPPHPSVFREDRKRRRAAKKRAKQGGDKQKESERKSRTVAQGGDASIAGRKSDTKVSERGQSKRVKRLAGHHATQTCRCCAREAQCRGPFEV